MLVDTHCHLHDTEFFPETREEVYTQSIAAGVSMICVGTDARSSRQAVEFCASHDKCFPVVGVHPHESKHGWNEIEILLKEQFSVAQTATSGSPINYADFAFPAKRGKTNNQLAPSESAKLIGLPRIENISQILPSIIGIGEIGLDYYYDHSPRQAQIAALEAQIQLALDYNLPISFHVRDAFDDFWPIFDNFHGIRGVMHSFTDIQSNLDKGFERGLYVGVNGISTFTKDQAQQELYAHIPLQKLLLETDAPFLTPAPFRGKVNSSAYVERVAEHMAHIRGVSLDEVADATTANAKELFGIKI